MIKRFAILLTIILILSLGTQFQAQADDTFFSISGTVSVTDNYSLGNGGITVSFGSYSAITDSTGLYTIANIPDGTSATLTPTSGCDLNFTPGTNTIIGNT
ncbi:MAG TPA: hypothetical protein VKF38_07030, partial [Anaerolineaceae bacterium]|nr:hypothetical protein [Anaerolineaceae bacterium]